MLKWVWHSNPERSTWKQSRYQQVIILAGLHVVSCDFSDEFPCSGIHVIHKTSVVHTNIYSFNSKEEFRKLQKIVQWSLNFPKCSWLSLPSPQKIRSVIVTYVCTYISSYGVTVYHTAMGKVWFDNRPTTVLDKLKTSFFAISWENIKQLYIESISPQSLLKSETDITIPCCFIMALSPLLGALKLRHLSSQDLSQIFQLYHLIFLAGNTVQLSCFLHIHPCRS